MKCLLVALVDLFLLGFKCFSVLQILPHTCGLVNAGFLRVVSC